MKKLFTLIALTCILFASQAQVSYKHPHNQSFTYEEALASFESLDEQYPQIKLIETPYKTDVGRPLHVAIFSNDEAFEPNKINREEQVVLFINNAIHPGESCGVDATVKLFEKLGKYHQLYQNVVVVAIPVYNIGGMLNRSPYKRSGQPGPVECGFRGNYQHLDLNRDFIKTDALNTEGFVQLFQSWNPNLFMDTHTTNGSDHQYTLTLITSQQDKMNPVLRDYVYGKMEPLLYQEMKNRGKEIVPYVYSIKGNPKNGIKDFMETPRYSSGYTNLFNCISFITEAHKYKAFEQRVEHTFTFMDYLCEYANRSAEDLIVVKKLADQESALQKEFELNWKLDTNTYDSLPFKGYVLESVKSEVTGLNRNYYNTDKPQTFSMKHFRTYTASDVVKCPDYYILPQCYRKIIKLLGLNDISYSVLNKDSLFNGEMYMVSAVKSVQNPYEKHYVYRQIEVDKTFQEVKYYRGDILIPTNQKNKRFIVEVLEPHASDSYFRWNYFDNILQQKEWFSDFAFDPIAQEILEKDDNLRKEFESKCKIDTTFDQSHFLKLQWIFERSPYYEREHNRYPVMRYFE